MSVNLGLESISIQKCDQLTAFDMIDIYEDRLSFKDLSQLISEGFAELDAKIVGLENLIAIGNHIKEHGSSEALIDLVGQDFSNENVIVEGIKKAVKWIIEQIQKLLALIARGLNKLAGVKQKVQTVEKIVEKIKEVPVEVIKEKEVVKTIEVAIEKPVYVEKESEWKFKTDVLGESQEMFNLCKIVLAMRYGSDIKLPDNLKEFVTKYDRFGAGSPFYNDYFGKYEKETILKTSQLVTVAENCSRIVNDANKGLDDAQRKLHSAEKYYKELKADKTIDAKELQIAKEAMQGWNKVTKFGFYLIDHASFTAGFLTKEFLGESRLYTDKQN